MKLKIKTLLILAVTFCSIVSSAFANTGILLVDWNTANGSTYTGGATLGSRTVTSVTRGSYSNAGGIYVGNWVNMLGSSYDLDADNDQGLSFATTTSGQNVNVTFSSSVTNPYLFFNWVDNSSTTYDFSGMGSSIVTVLNSTGSGTASNSGDKVTASGYGNTASDGFVVQLSGTYTSISFNAQSGSNDTAHLSVGVLGYSVTTTIGLNGSASVSGLTLSAGTTSKQLVEATGNETLNYAFTAAGGYGLASASTTTCGGALTVNFITPVITSNCLINASFALPSLSPSTQSVSGTVGSPITASTAYTAVNFSGTVSYSVSPTLPSGLSFSTTTGVISGTPSASQSASTYTVTGTGSGSGTATATVSIAVAFSNPASKADVISGNAASIASAKTLTRGSLRNVSMRMDWLRRHKHSLKKSAQGVNLIFNNSFLQQYFDGTSAQNNSFDRASAEKLAKKLGQSPSRALTHSKALLASKIISKVNDELGKINFNPTGGKIFGGWNLWSAGQITIGKSQSSKTVSYTHLTLPTILRV